MDITDIIKQNLKAMGEDYDGLKPFMKEWLKKVETAIQDRVQKQKIAEQTLKGIDCSVKAIATEINASRTTLYNHEHLIKRYIEQSSSSALTGGPLEEIKRLQAERSLMRDQIDKMMQRDVDMELLKIQNNTLAATLEGKNAEIVRLEERIIELSRENDQLRGPFQNAGNKRPIPFRKK